MDLMLFDSEQFGLVRVVADEVGEPWFVAMDVAEALGYSDTEAMTRRLDDDEKQNRHLVGFGNRGVTVINESGLFSAILGSSKPEAKHFKRWVTGDVLPSIRRHGGYIAGQEQDDPELIMAKALQVAQSVIVRKTAELEHAKKTIANQAPAVEFAKKIASAEKGVQISNFAKTLGLGPLKLFDQLREMRILMGGNGHRRNLPFQEYLDRGYFSVRESHYEANGETRLSFTPLITGKGQQWLTTKLIEAGVLKGVAA